MPAGPVSHLSHVAAGRLRPLRRPRAAPKHRGEPEHGVKR